MLARPPRSPARAAARRFALALTVASGGCAPIADLPQPSSPFSYYEPAPAIVVPSPDPDGPCLQRISRRRRGTWLWKHGYLVGDGGLTQATRDLPEANALARGARARERAALPLFLSGAAGLLSTIIATAAQLGADPDRWLGPALTFGIGFATAGALVATSIALGISGEHRAERALAVYNFWAADHGCSDPPTSSPRR